MLQTWGFRRALSPVSREWADRREHLSGRTGDDFPQVLVVGDTVFDFQHELRRVALYHLPDARSKLVEEVDPRVVANRRTKIVERRRRGARPIWTVSIVESNRTQYPEKIRSVQSLLPGVVTRDTNTRSCVGGPAHEAAAGRRVIKQVLLEQRRIQVLTNKVAGLFLSKRRFIGSDKSGLRSGSDVSRFCSAPYARVDANRAKC